MAGIALMPICCAAGTSGDSSFCHYSDEGSCGCCVAADSHEWAWDVTFQTADIKLVAENRGILFHPGYSSGTAAVRGDTPFEDGRDYYWEIKMLTPLYGTDVMVGVGTSKAELSKSRYKFCSLLGSDEESWGYSYKGTIHHNGEMKSYGPGFGLGCVIGVRLDMWRGTLQFFLNRIPLGVAYTNLKNKILFPMVSSTAARSSMLVIYSFSCKSSLQLLCMQALANHKSQMRDLLRVPGFRKRFRSAFWWLASDPFVHRCNLECASHTASHAKRNEAEQQQSNTGVCASHTASHAKRNEAEQQQSNTGSVVSASS